MKRLLISICLVLLITGCSANKNINELETDYFYNFQSDSNKEIVDIILYFENKESRLLIPEWRRVAKTDKKIEATIVSELFKGPLVRGGHPVISDEVKCLWVMSKGRIAFVNLQGINKYNQKSGPEENSIMICSIVNSLTELPHVDSVQFLVEGREWGKPFERIRNYLKRENLSPSQVMKKQMTLEKCGDLLNAYLLLADDKGNKGRKSFDEYVREIKEARQEGLMEADFGIGEFTVDTNDCNRAAVKVNFITRSPEGTYVKGPDVFFNTVRIDGYWMVDWFAGES